MLVVARQLSKAYGFLWALKDIHLELHSGECIALLGPNGAGKTTLLKLLSALVYPTIGEIEIDGERFLPGSSGLRSTVGLLSPDGYLYESLTARENLLLFISLYTRVKEPRKLEEALDHVKLLRWADEPVSSLSTGMKYRLALAKWLLLEPKLLLLDEPYAVLDGTGVDLLDAYLERLCRSGGIVMMATHHVPRALSLCSRAIILNQGRLIFDEPRREPWESFHRAFEAFLPRGERWRS